MPTTSGLRCAYLTADALSRVLTQDKGQVRAMLGGICFMAHGVDALPATIVGAPDLPLVALSMAPLLPITPIPSDIEQIACLYEIWFADGEIVRNQRGAVRYSCNEQLLYGVIELDEHTFTHQPEALQNGQSPKTPLQQASEHAYASLFETVDALGYPTVLRLWNYIADINGMSFGVERYRQFNSGRQEGFLRHGRAVSGCVPVASAVGMRAGPLTLCFLASRGDAPTAIENPRQVSAYQYPREYGVTSPIFTRASVAPLAGGESLFISGTASIVGHQTLHAGDVLAQAQETVANLQAILAQAHRIRPDLTYTLADLCCKVYVRNADPSDVAALDIALRAILGPLPGLLYVQADICRADLAMEIEATAGHPVAFYA